MDKGWLCLLLLLLGNCLEAAAQQEECFQQLLSSFQQMQKGAESEKGIFLHYKTTTTYRQPGNATINTSEQTVKLYLNLHRSKMLTETAAIFRDTVAQAVVMHDQKTVFISDALVMNQAQAAWSGLVQDSLFRHTQLVSCALNGKGQQKIELQADPALQKSTGINRLTYTLNVSDYSLANVLVQFVPEHQNQSIEVSFIAMDLAYKKQPFSGTALQNVLSGSTQLKPDFAGYKLLDVRKHK